MSLAEQLLIAEIAVSVEVEHAFRAKTTGALKRRRKKHKK
jgi:hypothetical protein